MPKLFTLTRSGEKEGTVLRVALDVRIGGESIPYPVSSDCRSYEGLVAEIRRIQEELQGILSEGERLFTADRPSDGPGIDPEMGPQEIWDQLSQEGNEEDFVQHFNELGEEKRREIAEYVFRECNVFSGKASRFAALFNTKTGFLE